MMEERKLMNIPAEKFTFAQRDARIHDTKLETKPIGYFKDAWLRFKKNKSAVVAFSLIVILLLFAIIVPFVSHYDVSFRDGFYKTVLPKNSFFAQFGIWDGCTNKQETQGGYDYLHAIGQETGRNVVVRDIDHTVDANGLSYYTMKVDSYALVGFTYANLSEKDYNALMDYQDQTGVQVIYPLQQTHKTNYVMGNAGANFWYKLKNEDATSAGEAVYDENGNYIPNYITSENKEQANYRSLRIEGDNGGEDGNTWYVYAQKNQSGYKVRVDYFEYFRYNNGVEP